MSLKDQARALVIRAEQLEERADTAPFADPADRAAAYKEAAELRDLADVTYRAAGVDPTA